MTKISIITINLNNAEGLKKTINSVKIQNYSNIEYIIIDGGSNDNSIEIIKQNDEHITYYISEKDNGIYEAMNKGIIRSTGDFCLFLNSGDYLYKDSTINDCIELIKKNETDFEIFYGDMYYSGYLIHSFQKIDLNHFSIASLPHPATFISRKLFQENNVGMYNEDYKIISDWLFFLKAYSLQKKFKHINISVTVFEGNGISENSALIAFETTDSLNRLYPNFIEDFAVFKEYRIYKYSRIHQAAAKVRNWYIKYFSRQVKS